MRELALAVVLLAGAVTARAAGAPVKLASIEAPVEVRAAAESIPSFGARAEKFALDVAAASSGDPVIALRAEDGLAVMAHDFRFYGWVPADPRKQAFAAVVPLDGEQSVEAVLKYGQGGKTKDHSELHAYLGGLFDRALRDAGRFFDSR